MFTNNVVLHLHRCLARWSNKTPMVQRQSRSIISFTFDDFPRSALTVGGELLGKYGVRGTYYASLGLMNRTTVVGEMFKPSDLQWLTESGHELACHTYDHTRASDVTTTELQAQCSRNRESISAVCNGYKSRNFSFPEGVVTVASKAAMRRLYDTCRTVEPGINCDLVDFGFLRANPVYSKIDIQTTKQKIYENQSRHGWLILYTHDICDTPSVYGCTPTYFEEVLRCAVDSGADVLTIAEATHRFERLSKAA